MMKFLNLGSKLIGAWKWWTLLTVVLCLWAVFTVGLYRHAHQLSLDLRTCQDSVKTKDGEISRLRKLTSSTAQSGARSIITTEKECLNEVRAAYDAGAAGQRLSIRDAQAAARHDPAVSTGGARGKSG